MEQRRGKRKIVEGKMCGEEGDVLGKKEDINPVQQIEPLTVPVRKCIWKCRSQNQEERKQQTWTLFHNRPVSVRTVTHCSKYMCLYD